MRSFKPLVVMLFALASPAYAYRMSAWVPPWDANSATIMSTHARDLDESNPGWYTAVADGSVAPSSGGETATLRSALTGTLLVPTIANYVNGGFDGGMMSTIVNDAALREKHAEAIRQLVVQRAYDGIDLDYEAMPATAKTGFTSFVQLLASKLHASNKVLSVTVHPKTSASATWDGPGAQDYPAIGAAADSVKIMAYDYHWSTSDAGALAPLSWLDQIAAYAESTMPSSKVIMGLPWYGYDWLGTNAAGVTYAQAIAKAQTAGATIGRDANDEATYSYSGRTVFFQDATSYRRKVDTILGRHPNIGGFAHWRVGAEDPAIWDIVAQVRATGSTATTAPKADFAISGPADLTTAAGTQISATYGFTGINGFTGPVTIAMRVVDAYGATPAISGTTVTVAVPKNTAAGSYRLMLTMTGGGLSHEQLVTLHVTKPKSVKQRSVR